MIKAIEKYYTVQHLAWLLEFDRKTIGNWIHEGLFGPDVLNVNGDDLRVPASGVNAWLENQRLLQGASPAAAVPIAARSEGELRRKVNERS